MYCMAKEGEAVYLDCKECEEKLCEYFFCLVVGSRSFTDYEFMKKKLDKILSGFSRIVIVSGGCSRGADKLAERYAKEKGYEMKIFHAEWDKYGKSAGYIRNSQMHEYIARAKYRGCVAFWDGQSKGTEHNFALAKKHGNQIRIIKF